MRRTTRRRWSVLEGWKGLYLFVLIFGVLQIGLLLFSPPCSINLMRTADWLIFALYIGSLFLGLWMTAGQEYRAYYLEIRLPWWAVGFSVMATQASAITFISTTARHSTMECASSGYFAAVCSCCSL
jgi:hypothetical protein